MLDPGETNRAAVGGVPCLRRRAARYKDGRGRWILHSGDGRAEEAGTGSQRLLRMAEPGEGGTCTVAIAVRRMLEPTEVYRASSRHSGRPPCEVSVAGAGRGCSLLVRESKACGYQH